MSSQPCGFPTGSAGLGARSWDLGGFGQWECELCSSVGSHQLLDLTNSCSLIPGKWDFNGIWLGFIPSGSCLSDVLGVE